MHSGSAPKQTSKCILLLSEGKILIMPMENHSCEDILNCNTQAREDNSKKIMVYTIVLQSCKVGAALRESEQ